MTKIYTRIVLDWDLVVHEEESFNYSGPLSLAMPSDGGGGPSGGDGDRGSGGSSDSGRGDSGGSERGVGNRTASRGGYGAEDSMGWGGSAPGRGSNDSGWGGLFSGKTTGFTGAINNALDSYARDVFGSMGLAGAHASASFGSSSGGGGFGGYAGAIGTPDTFDWSGLWSDPINEIMGTPNFTDLDSPALGFAAFNDLSMAMSGVLGQNPADFADLANVMDSLGWSSPGQVTPEGITANLPGINDEIADRMDDLGLTSYDTMNNTFAKDVHADVFGQRVSDINAAARSVGYDNVVGFTMDQAMKSINGQKAMTPSDVKDLAQVSIGDIVGTAAKTLGGPFGIATAIADIAGYSTKNLHARDVIGTLTRGIGASRSLGSAFAVANLLSPGLSALGPIAGLLSTGFAGPALTAVKEMNRTLDPMSYMDLANSLEARGLSMESLSGDSSTTARAMGQATPSATTVGGGSALRGSRSTFGLSEEGGGSWYSNRTKMMPFASVEGSFIPFNSDIVDEEEPWYGTNQAGNSGRSAEELIKRAAVSNPGNQTRA